MHSFQHLDLKTLRKICSKYNLHVKIAKYSKLSKEELIPHMEKHLHINEHGKIKMRDGVCDNVSNELSKMVEELHAKLKAVKEKIKKPRAKKERLIIKLDELEEKKLKETPAMAKKRAELVQRIEKLKGHYDNAIINDFNDKIKNYAPIDIIELQLEGFEEDLKKKSKPHKASPKKNEEFEKAKMKKKEILEKMEKIKIPKIPSSKKGLNMKEQAMKEIIQMQKEQQARMPPANIKPKPPSMPPPAHLKKGLNLGGIKLPPKKTFEMAKAEKEALMPKIDMIQQELHRLEKMIHMDEKQNAKEHHKLEEEIHDRRDIFEKEEDEKHHKAHKQHMEREVIKALENLSYFTDDKYAMWKKEKKEDKERYIKDIIKFKYQEYIKHYPSIFNYYKKYLKHHNIDEALEDNIYESGKEQFMKNYNIDLDKVRDEAIKKYGKKHLK
jgi:hypothetical protein